MTLGFYYHIPADSRDGGIFTPSYLGVFLDGLAASVDELVLFMHRAVGDERGLCDYRLQTTNARWVDLGPKRPAWSRFLNPYASLRGLRSAVRQCNCVLVRAPSPLAPAWAAAFGTDTKICFLVIGDYSEGLKHQRQPWYRRLPIVWLALRNDRQLTSAVSRAFTVVNSLALADKYGGLSPRLQLTRTSTVSHDDIVQPSDTCQGEEVRLLFAGRFDPAKGLFELLDATASLRRSGRHVSLHLVGWETDAAAPVQERLKARAATHGIEHAVHFHGKMTVGPELNTVYRSCDIYVIPSYHEGFPRTIWEAMANGLPVIASAVGSIPQTLENEQDVLLVRPRRVDDITAAVCRIIDDGALRRRMISRGHMHALDSRVEVQAQRLVALLTEATRA